MSKHPRLRRAWEAAKMRASKRPRMLVASEVAKQPRLLVALEAAKHPRMLVALEAAKHPRLLLASEAAKLTAFELTASGRVSVWAASPCW
jgi:hypothetical protein